MREPPVTTDDSFKVWKETEEKFLIDTRHQMDDLFKRNRNHGELWKAISGKVFDVLNCRVTQNQCMYKYNSLKKKWKEVIDAPSGSEAKHFSHKEEFDQFYGTKASTKPQHTIDSDRKMDEVQPDDVDEEMISVKKRKKKMKTCKQDVRELLEEQHSQFLSQMEKMHNDKMQKFDKFLEIMSKK
jgi:hypothetical protein